MSTIDLIFLITLGGFTLFGLWFGLIHTLGALVGTILGAIVAGNYYEPVAEWSGFLFGDHENLARLVCFLLIFIIVNRLVGFIFHLLDKAFNIITKLPFLNAINRLAGAVLGFMEGILIIGMFVYIASRFPLIEWFNTALVTSKIAPWSLGAAKILVPLLPEFLDKLKSFL